MAISEDDLRGLSAVEREALLSVDEDDEDVAHELGQSADAPRAPRTEPELETDPEDEAAAAAAAAATTPPAEGKRADPPAGIQSEVEEEPDTDLAPMRNAPADIEDQRTALNQREDESMQKLLDGEITQEEHAAVKNEVRAKLNELLVLEATDKAAEQIQRNEMLKAYNVDLRATVKLGKAAGLDYTEDAAGKQFDRAVRMFSQQFAEDGIYD